MADLSKLFVNGTNKAYSSDLVKESNKIYFFEDAIATQGKVYRSASENAVNYLDFERNGESRKTIQLANYDNISGMGADCSSDENGENLSNSAFNLVMLSKWNVADFGSTGVHMNLNTKDVVTINDEQVVATVEYKDGNLTISDGTSDNEGWKVATVDMIPSIDGLVNEDTVKGLIAQVVDDAPEAFDTLKEMHDWISGHETDVISMNANITANTNAITANAAAIAKNAEDIATLDGKSVKFTDFEYKGNRKTIQLANYDSISGMGTNCLPDAENGYENGEDLSNSAFNLVMLSKWNVADFGSTGVHMNLNSKGGKVTINDDKEVATVDMLEALESWNPWETIE